MDRWKNLPTDFVSEILVSTNQKGETYDLILVIIDMLMKMVNYKLIKVSIDGVVLVKVIITIIVWHYSLPHSIVSD